MSRAFINRRKAIRKMRYGELAEESVDMLRHYAVPHNDRWSRIAAVLALEDDSDNGALEFAKSQGWWFVEQAQTEVVFIPDTRVLH